MSYTYVQLSLGVPWGLYFMFLALVTVPFAVMILRAHPAASRFLRLGLPLLLVVVFSIVALFVVNALEATALMQVEKRAGPTILNR